MSSTSVHGSISSSFQNRLVWIPDFFGQRRLVCLFVAFLRSIPGLHEHVFCCFASSYPCSTLAGKLSTRRGRAYFSSLFRFCISSSIISRWSASFFFPAPCWLAPPSKLESARTGQSLSCSFLEFLKIGGNCTTYFLLFFFFFSVGLLLSFSSESFSHLIGTYQEVASFYHRPRGRFISSAVQSVRSASFFGASCNRFVSIFTCPVRVFGEGSMRDGRV